MIFMTWLASTRFGVFPRYALRRRFCGLAIAFLTSLPGKGHLLLCGCLEFLRVRFEFGQAVFAAKENLSTLVGRKEISFDVT